MDYLTTTDSNSAQSVNLPEPYVVGIEDSRLVGQSASVRPDRPVHGSKRLRVEFHPATETILLLRFSPSKKLTLGLRTKFVETKRMLIQI